MTFPYILIGIDPGNTTGLAWYDPNPADGHSYFECVEETDPTEIYQHVKAFALRPKRSIIVVEDFVGSGHLTGEAKQTVMVLGMARFGFCTTKNIHNVVVRNPQQRKAWVRSAKELMEQRGYTTHKGGGADSLSALAHCLSYHNEVSRKFANAR